VPIARARLLGTALAVEVVEAEVEVVVGIGVAIEVEFKVEDGTGTVLLTGAYLLNQQAAQSSGQQCYVLECSVLCKRERNLLVIIAAD